ncbi:MAG: hydroxyethylthiazole kinase [Tannerellaceae bacterium]|nr:hydroxyethylthiazole kinase [Tannerellaceae bacterium]
MIKIESLERDLAAIRQNSPLIHNITNYVGMNITANALLAIGASPVMAHTVEEVAEMASIASALVLNIGTLDHAQVEAMRIAGETASELDKPIVFDPVGAGATVYRTSTCKELIEACSPTIIRGNASEIMALCDSAVQTKGVDNTQSADTALGCAIQLAQQTGAIVTISGPTDYITDGTKTGTVKNGSPLMEKVTGLGCTATAIVAAFAAVNDDPFEAALHGMAVMGIAGELAASKAEGTGSMQVIFLDELYKLNNDIIRKYLIL